jgi:hypothetical protein
MLRILVSTYLFFTSLSSTVFANEIAANLSNDSITSVASEQLPKCVDGEQKDSIRQFIKANKNSLNKYAKMTEALVSDSDQELMSRLIYAETLAANCPQENQKIAEAISLVVRNRVKKRNSVKSVVFQKDQFASSLNVYEESRINDFLCPKDQKLWQAVVNSISRDRTFKNNINSSDPTSVMHYFLYNHSPRFKKEPWTMKEYSFREGGPSSQCLRVFINENWN